MPNVDIDAIVEWALAVIGGLGFVLPIAIFILVNLFGRLTRSRRSAGQPAQPQSGRPEPRAPWTTMQPMPSFPNGPVTWAGSSSPTPTPPAAPARRSGWGSSFDANDAARDDRALQWGSAFDDNDAEKRDHGLQWGSAFDRERDRPKWGWDEAEWGGGFATKKDAEPRITVG